MCVDVCGGMLRVNECLYVYNSEDSLRNGYCFDTGSAQKLDYRSESACWSESPMDLPVSESPVLVLKLYAQLLCGC